MRKGHTCNHLHDNHSLHPGYKLRIIRGRSNVFNNTKPLQSSCKNVPIIIDILPHDLVKCYRKIPWVSPFSWRKKKNVVICYRSVEERSIAFICLDEERNPTVLTVFLINVFCFTLQKARTATTLLQQNNYRSYVPLSSFVEDSLNEYMIIKRNTGHRT